jgi:hypothetical protein
VSASCPVSAICRSLHHCVLPLRGLWTEQNHRHHARGWLSCRRRHEASHVAGTAGILTPVPPRTYAIDHTSHRPQKHPPNWMKGRGQPSPAGEAEDARLRTAAHRSRTRRRDLDRERDPERPPAESPSLLVVASRGDSRAMLHRRTSPRNGAAPAGPLS